LPGAPPFFVNATYLRERVFAVADAAEDVTWLVLNAEAWTYLDSPAIDVLARLVGDLEERGIILCLARLKARERAILEDTGLATRIGRDRLFPTVRAPSRRSRRPGRTSSADRCGVSRSALLRLGVAHPHRAC